KRECKGYVTCRGSRRALLVHTYGRDRRTRVARRYCSCPFALVTIGLTTRRWTSLFEQPKFSTHDVYVRVHSLPLSGRTWVNAVTLDAYRYHMDAGGLVPGLVHSDYPGRWPQLRANRTPGV